MASSAPRPWIASSDSSSGFTLATLDVANGVAVSMIAFCLGYFPLLSLTSRTFPDMVMDESFHVKQAQEMCRHGLFSAPWDPKITTFPGLYVLPTLLSRSDLLPSWDSEAICSIPFLRLTSAVAAAVAVGVAYGIARMNRDSTPLAASRSLLIASIPPFAFFSTLYYTESIAVLALLGAKWAQQRTRRVMLFEARARRRKGFIFFGFFSTLFWGAFAILCRQTNAVWLLFFVMEATLQHLKANVRNLGPLDIIKQAIRDWRRVIGMQAPFLLCIFSFAIFVVFFNDGKLVVGDHSAHSAAMHWAQPLYLCAFLVAIFMPAVVSNIIGKDSLLLFRRPFPLFSLFHLSVIAVAMIHFGTIVHPYILADNRHLTFYIWKDILGPLGRTGRWSLAPVYAAAAWIVYTMIRHKGWAWISCLVVCTLAQLVPSGLMEVRYFIPATVVIVLNMRMEPRRIMYCVGNCVAMIAGVHYIFVKRGIMY